MFDVDGVAGVFRRQYHEGYCPKSEPSVLIGAGDPSWPDSNFTVGIRKNVGTSFHRRAFGLAPISCTSVHVSR
jgi:hypothetical protein